MSKEREQARQTEQLTVKLKYNSQTTDLMCGLHSHGLCGKAIKRPFEKGVYKPVKDRRLVLSSVAMRTLVHRLSMISMVAIMMILCHSSGASKYRPNLWDRDRKSVV